MNVSRQKHASSKKAQSPLRSHFVIFQPLNLRRIKPSPFADCVLMKIPPAGEYNLGIICFQEIERKEEILVIKVVDSSSRPCTSLQVNQECSNGPMTHSIKCSEPFNILFVLHFALPFFIKASILQTLSKRSFGGGGVHKKPKEADGAGESITMVGGPSVLLPRLPSDDVSFRLLRS